MIRAGSSVGVRHVSLTALVALLISVATLAQQRDMGTTTSGTSEINGTVLSAERQPIRRAIVSIASPALAAARSVITDDAGRFAFSRLAPGEYTITATKPAYLGTEFGSSKPGRPGSRVALTTGERRVITLTMFKGAAVSGAVRGNNGAPMAGISVVAVGSSTARRRELSETSITDDRGEYRIYGLTPGEYLVAATPNTGGSGEIGARPSADMDAFLASLAQRENRASQPGSSRPPVPTPPPAPSVGYAPIYFPGTALMSEAGRIRLASGDDRSGLNFEVSRVPVASIEGKVTGDVPSLAGVQLAILPDDMELIEGGSFGLFLVITAVPPNADGEYKFGNLFPGKYRVVAKGRRAGLDPVPPSVAPPSGRGGARIGGGGVGAALMGTGQVLFAVADLEIRGQDVKGVNLELQPGGAIAGNIVFDATGTTPPPDFSTVRLSLAPLGNNTTFMFGSVRIGSILNEVTDAFGRADGTFQFSGIGPAIYRLTSTLPVDATPVWKMRSALVSGRDLLDSDVAGPNLQLTGATVTFSDKRTEIAGALLSSTNQPVTEYFVIAFSTDRANWRAGARRLLAARPATNGRYVFSDLPAGEYFVAALTDLDPAEWQNAAFLDQVAPAAIKISVGEGEKKVQDLRIK